MNKKHAFIAGIMLTAVIVASCDSAPETTGYSPTNATMKEPGDKGGIPVVTDNSKGEGKYKEVPLTHPLNEGMAKQGKAVYGVKCAACHKLTDEKLVGPGWKGVTDRRKPEWIMNFITNTDEMMDKDPAAQAMLDKCIVRMPNQHLKDTEAREILEFMRGNDGKN